MKAERINQLIAEYCGKANLFVIHKPIHAPFGYYRKDACGYTGNKNEAWVVTAEVAAKYVTGPAYTNEPDKVVAEPAPIPNYCGDLNAMHEAENSLNNSEKRALYIDYLGETFQDSWEFCTATAAQRAEAFLRTIGKWEDE